MTGVQTCALPIYYIERKEQEITPPAEVRKQYFDALEKMIEAEKTMMELLLEGGYVNE